MGERQRDVEAKPEQRASTAPDRATPQPTPSSLVTLAGTVGNAAMVRLMRSGGPAALTVAGLPVSAPDSPAEVQAADLAERPAEHRDRLATAAAPAEPPAMPGSSGRPLDAAVRRPYEESLGADLSEVRVHSDAGAHAFAHEAGALAATVGSRVYFAAGQFAPDMAAGQRLLGHELAHTVQTAPDAGVQRSPEDVAARFNAALAGRNWLDAARAIAEMSPADRNAELRALSPEGRGALRDASNILEPTATNPVVAAIDAVQGSAVGGGATPPVDVAAMSTTDKLLKAKDYAMEHLGPDVRAQVEALFSPQSLAMMAGFAVVYVAAQLTPAGWVADGLALATLSISAIFLGRVVLDVSLDMARFLAAANATTDAELRASGAALSHGIAVGGVALFTALLAKAVGGGKGGGRPYEGPPPSGYVEALTTEGVLVRMPAAAVAEVASAPASALQQAAAYAVMTPPPGGPGPSSSGGGGGPPKAERGPEIWDEVSKELGLEPPGPEMSPAEAAARAEQGGLTGPRGAPGTVDLATQPHGNASAIRGQYGVSGTDVQSAHVGPTSFLRDVPGYSRSGAETVLLDRATHAALDQHWKSWAIAQRQAGRVAVPVSELYSVMLDAIEQTPGLAQRTKNALAWRLQLELFRDLNLSPATTVELPYSNVPAAAVK